MLESIDHYYRAMTEEDGGAAERLTDAGFVGKEHLPRVEALMQKYRSLPMDVADASLVVLAEESGSGEILSTDTRDFGAYRWKNRKPFRNLLAV